ncbi:MAG: hypothetical protein HYY03_01200 [Chloroflexi bacterium]|nr:hypothetical protein [Chloroflexota bacterium]
MELGLSREELLEEWNKAAQSATPEGQATARAALKAGDKVPTMKGEGPLDDLQLTIVSFVNNVVRLNNRRMQEQLKKAGLKLDN